MFHGFQSYTPQNPALRSLISYYYFDGGNDPAFQHTYTFYPHTKTTLSFYQGADISIAGNYISVQGNGRQNLQLRITRQQTPKVVHVKGAVRKIAIVFNPLGLNHFIAENLQDLAPQDAMPFQPRNARQWRITLETCFAQNTHAQALALLEAFLLAQLQPRDFSLLHHCVAALCDLENIVTIQSLAQQHGTNRRTIDRQFKKHLCTTPEQFRMVARFRAALDRQFGRCPANSITRLAYACGYNDQSYMIRSFKKLAHQTPLHFFRETKQLGQQDTYWKLATPVA